MKSTVSPAALEINCHASRILGWGIAVLLLTCLVFLSLSCLSFSGPVQGLLSVSGRDLSSSADFGTPLYEDVLRFGLMLVVALYGGTMLKRYSQHPCYSRPRLRCLHGEWSLYLDGEFQHVLVNWEYVSRYLLIARVAIDGRKLRLPIVSDQLDAEGHRALRRLALYGA